MIYDINGSEDSPPARRRNKEVHYDPLSPPPPPPPPHTHTHTRTPHSHTHTHQTQSYLVRREMKSNPFSRRLRACFRVALCHMGMPREYIIAIPERYPVGRWWPRKAASPCRRIRNGPSTLFSRNTFRTHMPSLTPAKRIHLTTNIWRFLAQVDGSFGKASGGWITSCAGKGSPKCVFKCGIASQSKDAIWGRDRCAPRAMSYNR